MQMEALECGAACLTMVLAYYGRWVPLEQVRMDCGVSRDGSKAKNVLNAAKSYGLDARGFRAGLDALRENVAFPCIVHWNYSHFVVLCGFHGKHAYINDPARGSVRVTLEEFEQSYTGIVLTFAPGERFAPGGKRASMLAFAKKAARRSGRRRCHCHADGLDRLSLYRDQPGVLTLLYGALADR